MQNYDYSRLHSSLVGVIQEAQAKIGYDRHAITFYYPASSVAHMLGTKEDADAVEQALAGFSAFAQPTLGGGILHAGHLHDALFKHRLGGRFQHDVDPRAAAYRLLGRSEPDEGEAERVARRGPDLIAAVRVGHRAPGSMLDDDRTARERGVVAGGHDPAGHGVRLRRRSQRQQAGEQERQTFHRTSNLGPSKLAKNGRKNKFFPPAGHFAVRIRATASAARA